MPSPTNTLGIILGLSECPRAPKLQPLPQCANSAHDFEEYLRSGLRIPSGNLLNLFDSGDTADEQLDQIEKWLEGRPTATDMILFYTGHGGFARNDRAFFLAVRRTREGSEGGSSIRYIDLALAIKRRARSLRKYLIPDCCYAAAAISGMQTDLNQLVIKSVEDQLPPSGTAALCSSSANLFSLAPPDQRHTMFTGALLECLKQGISGYSAELSLEEVGRRTEEIIAHKFPDDWIRPELHVPDQARGNPAKVPLFPNKSWSPPALPFEVGAPPQPKPPEVDAPHKPDGPAAQKPTSTPNWGWMIKLFSVLLGATLAVLVFVQVRNSKTTEPATPSRLDPVTVSRLEFTSGTQSNGTYTLRADYFADRHTPIELLCLAQLRTSSNRLLGAADTSEPFQVGNNTRSHINYFNVDINDKPEDFRLKCNGAGVDFITPWSSVRLQP